MVTYQCVVKVKEKQHINLFGDIKIKNMKEELVSFQVAKLAKEKGFGLSKKHYIKLPNWYTSEGEIKSSKPRICKIHSLSWLGADTIEDFKATYELMDNSMDDLILAPTQSLLQ